MGNRSRYRKSADLLVKGTELVLPDGNVMFLKVLNDFEVAECRRAAQAARGLYTLATKSQGTEEFAAVQAAFLARTRQEAAQELLGAKESQFFLKATEEIEADPEWQEKLEILKRADTDEYPEGDPQREQVAELNREWLAEVNRKQAEEVEYQAGVYERMPIEELKDAYCGEWLERRASGIGLEAYNVHEVLYGARCCEAKPDENGEFPEGAHEECDHRERVYLEKNEVMEDGELYELIRKAYNDISMTVREAKN